MKHGRRVRPRARCARLAERRLRRRALARAPVERDGRLGLAGLGAVAGQHLGVAVHHLRTQPLNGLGGPSVEGAPALAQEGAVGSVLDERVLEHVGRMRRRAAAVHQVRGGKRVQRFAQRRLGQVGDGGEQVVRELPAQHRPGLRRFPRRGEPVQAGHQRGLQRRGHR